MSAVSSNRRFGQRCWKISVAFFSSTTATVRPDSPTAYAIVAASPSSNVLMRLPEVSSSKVRRMSARRETVPAQPLSSHARSSATWSHPSTGCRRISRCARRSITTRHGKTERISRATPVPRRLIATLASRTTVSIESTEADVNTVLRHVPKDALDHPPNVNAVQIEHPRHLSLREQPPVER